MDDMALGRLMRALGNPSLRSLVLAPGREAAVLHVRPGPHRGWVFTLECRPVLAGLLGAAATRAGSALPTVPVPPAAGRRAGARAARARGPRAPPGPAACWRCSCGTTPARARASDCPRSSSTRANRWRGCSSSTGRPRPTPRATRRWWSCPPGPTRRPDPPGRPGSAAVGQSGSGAKVRACGTRAAVAWVQMITSRLRSTDT